MPRNAGTTDLILDLGPPTANLINRLALALVKVMAGGQLVDGDDLPSTRVLAAHLSISRATVVGAYEELTASGFLIATPGGRTRVELGARNAALAGAFIGTPEPPTRAVVPGASSAPPRSSPPLFDMLPGYPDTTLIDQRGWNAALRRASREVLSWDDETGRDADSGRTHHFFPQLRELLRDHLRRNRGIVCESDDIFVFPGVNSAIRTLAGLLTSPGGILAFEDPGYATARRILAGTNSGIRSVPVDADGLRVDLLKSTDSAVYVTPAHQFPSGARLPVDRRASLLEWADRNKALIFEDDYDGEFRYDVAPMPALRSMKAGGDRVVYLGTASKVLVRDLRIAWAIVPPRYRDLVRQELFREGDSVSPLSAFAFAAYIESGALRRHIVTAQRTYSARRARLTQACQQLLPHMDLLGVSAGLHVVLASRDPQFDDIAAVRHLAEHGLACTAASQYYADPSAATIRGLVCGYSRLRETQAESAVELIRRVLSPAADHSPQRTFKPDKPVDQHHQNE